MEIIDFFLSPKLLNNDRKQLLQTSFAFGYLYLVSN
jgi:hypothetical protein